MNDDSFVTGVLLALAILAIWYTLHCSTNGIKIPLQNSVAIHTELWYLFTSVDAWHFGASLSER